MPATIHVDDLPPDQRSKLGVRKTRETKFTSEEVRGWALKILGAMAQLTRAERARVLRHAARVNEV